MMAWFKARWSEGNSRRGVAVAVGVLGATHILDAEALGAATAAIQQAAILLLAVDAFATKDGTDKRGDDGTGSGG
jgi:hypothetical protein